MRSSNAHNGQRSDMPTLALNRITRMRLHDEQPKRVRDLIAGAPVALSPQQIIPENEVAAFEKAFWEQMRTLFPTWQPLKRDPIKEGS